MNKPVQISDRAIGPVTPLSYKALARRRNKANGGEATSVMDLVNEKDRGETIQFTISNSKQSDMTVAVFPGRLASESAISRYAGLTVDHLVHEGAIKETGTSGETTVGNVSSKTLDLAQGWVKDHPMRFCKIKLNADNESQFGKEFGFAFFSLTHQKGIKTIVPNDYVNPNQFNKTMCEIDCNLQLDDATVMYFVIGAGRTLDVTLQTVAEMNLAAGLEAIDEKLTD